MQSTTSLSVPDRFRATFRRRGAAFVLALFVEILIALLLLGLIPTITPTDKPRTVTFGIEATDGDQPAAKEQPKAKAKAKTEQGDKPDQPQPVIKTEIVVPPPVPEARQPPSFLVLTRQDYAAGDIAKAKSSAAASSADSGDSANSSSSGAGDTPVIGKGPHGEPLYKAEWYREPTHAQIWPYVSSRWRGGKGVGYVACRTISRYQVTDCQELGESPRGSGLAGSVRQAAFQFLVRPPRKGGQVLVGAWVRIEIDYEQRSPDRSQQPDDQP